MYGLSDIMIPLRAVTGLKLTASYFSKHSGMMDNVLSLLFFPECVKVKIPIQKLINSFL